MRLSGRLLGDVRQMFVLISSLEVIDDFHDRA
jgi:hypothetical protein